MYTLGAIRYYVYLLIYSVNSLQIFNYGETNVSVIIVSENNSNNTLMYPYVKEVLYAVCR